MTTYDTLLIWGFGGHARSVADVALACGYVSLVFVDPQARSDENFLGHPVLASIDLADWAGQAAIVAIGDNASRARQQAVIEETGLDLVTLISPNASLGAGSQVGMGSFIGHHAHIGPMTRIGSGTIINTSAVVEHECEVGNFSHVSINAAMAGRSRLGDRSMLGAGATLLDRITVTEDVLIGGGALINRHITVAGTYVGVPARQVR